MSDRMSMALGSVIAEIWLCAFGSRVAASRGADALALLPTPGVPPPPPSAPMLLPPCDAEHGLRRAWQDACGFGCVRGGWLLPVCASEGV